MSSEIQNKKQILVIGGGIAGTEASVRLSGLGYQITLVEQSDKLGGKLNQWDRLFPEQKPAKELQQILVKGLNTNIKPLLNTTVCDIQKNNGKFKATLSDGQTIVSDAVLLSTGYDLFDARKKEEYGYGIYDNVITSADLEKIFREGRELKTAAGKTPKRIGIIHCVGSRDEKAGNTYCSQVCCITAVKQAIEIKEILPQTEVFCFYMDLRMFGRHFEDIYKKAQVNHNIQFIRGRLSEAFENSDGTVLLKAEDTLLNKPLKMNVDMVVLMVGMMPSKTAAHVSSMLKTNNGTDGFIAQPQGHYRLSCTNTPGVFSAGACTGPKTIEATLNDARSAALEVAEYLKSTNALLN
jgi:heterodisulfide reductase subunit A2